MSSEFYTPGGINPGRSNNMLPINNNPQIPFRSPLAGILPDPAAHLLQRRADLIGGKRSLADFQIQQNQLQQQQSLGVYLRNVKQKMYQQASSPISPLSRMNLSSVSSLLPEVSSVSSLSNGSSNMNPRYGVPILQQPRALPSINSDNFNMLGNGTNNFNNFVMSQSGQSNISFQNSLQNRNLGANMGVPTSSSSVLVQESESKMMNLLQELEKELLDDNDDGDQGAEEVSGVINSEWSETYQNLMVNQTSHKLNSLSPTSSSSSCSSTSASPVTSPKQLVIDAASAISEGKSDAAVEFLTRLSQVANVNGTPEQRLIAYMVSALRWRVNSTESPTRVSEIYSQEHTISTHKLYDVSACFKLGFMAANLAILEATTSEKCLNKLHVIDFDIGQEGQYVHLLHALAAKKENKPSLLKITTFTDFFGKGNEARLKVVGDTLKALASKIGISLIFNVMSLKINDLTKEKLGLESDEAVAVNLAFKLYRLPDESVTTENLRDEVLRRVKRLSPKVVTVVEKEMNCNTAGFVARVNEVFGYYSALFESLDGALARENPDRVRIEEGLGRKIGNSVACEGSERVERCEVFGKWRARMGMAGFGAKPMSQLVADSLRSKLSSMTRGNRGFTVNEQSGGICFGWMGRSLTVASAWH